MILRCPFCGHSHDQWICDLFCGKGGAAMGYHQAGLGVIGVDIEPQARYPFEFHQADALEVLEGDVFFAGFDAVHASPPCQDHIRSGMVPRHGTGWMLAETRRRLQARGLPWVIENVPGAPMRADLKLCGCMFGLELRRERWFETSWRAFDLRPPCHHSEPPVGVYGHPRGGEPGKTLGWGTYKDWVRAMGIDWMDTEGLAQAIPPAYTEYIGTQLLNHLAVTA